jgi:hypothetical protein
VPKQDNFSQKHFPRWPKPPRAFGISFKIKWLTADCHLVGSRENFLAARRYSSRIARSQIICRREAEVVTASPDGF